MSAGLALRPAARSTRRRVADAAPAWPRCSSGIGFATVQHLARRGAKVYIATRSEARGRDAVARLHAHASGEPCIYTPTGANTAVESGGIPIRYNPGGIKAGVMIPGNPKEARLFNGRRFIMEPAIAGDVAFVHAWKADEVGNLVFR